MSDAPQDEQLRIAKLIHRTVNKLRKGIEYGPTIFTDHTLRGGRCNGTEQLSTIVRNLRELREYRDQRTAELVLLTEHVAKTEAGIIKITTEFDKTLRVCSLCQGCGGTGRNGCYVDPWEDCTTCYGKGCVKK